MEARSEIEPLARRVRRYKIEQYLADLHCVIWPATHFDLTDQKELTEAVALIEELMDSVG